MSSDLMLEMKGICKTFPGVKAVDDVTLQVKRGTVHALVGENGAGKSTLMKILAGEHSADAGEVMFDGKPARIENTRDALELGISTIYQELNLVPEMTLGENLFLGREPLGKSRVLVDFKQISKRAGEYLRGVGLKYDEKTKMKNLSVSAQQMVEIAKGIHRGAKLIVMDEPTSAITETEVTTLFSLIRELRDQGITFIYISHKLDEIFSICDEITVMRDGCWVDTRPTADFDEKSLISLMVGRELKHLFPKAAVDVGETVFEVRGLTRKGVFSDISFSVRAGEILGFAGLVGAGRTEVMRAIFGLDPIDTGEMWLEGEPFKVSSPRDSIPAGVVYLPEDRKQIGLVLHRSVMENISLASLEKFTRNGLLNIGQEKKECLAMAEKLRVKTHSLYVDVKNLSGGNQQKVVISKWLLRNIKVLILDEPTRGIDVGAKSEIHRLMGEFAKRGMAIIMISSELPEVLGMSDRIMVMKEGRLMGEVTRAQATQERVMTLATGGTI